MANTLITSPRKARTTTSPKRKRIPSGYILWLNDYKQTVRNISTVLGYQMDFAEENRFLKDIWDDLPESAREIYNSRSAQMRD